MGNTQKWSTQPTESLSFYNHGVSKFLNSLARLFMESLDYFFHCRTYLNNVYGQMYDGFTEEKQIGIYGKIDTIH